MTDEQFWNLMEDAHRQASDKADAQARLLVEVLADRPIDDVVAFAQWFKYFTKRAGTSGLLAAHRLIQDGSHSDDGFQYFRAWLIGQGRAVYDAALADPESLAERLTDRGNPIEQTSAEPLMYVATRAASATLGEEAVEEDVALFTAMNAAPPGVPAFRRPVGVAEPQAPAPLPRLAERLEQLWSREPERPGNIASSPRPDGSTVHYHPGTRRVAFTLGPDGRPIRDVGDVS